MWLQILKNQKKKQMKNPISLVTQNLNKKNRNQPDSNLCRAYKLQKYPVNNLLFCILGQNL